MSNGVGIVAALTGSLPGIAGPRRSELPSGDARLARRSESGSLARKGPLKAVDVPLQIRPGAHAPKPVRSTSSSAALAPSRAELPVPVPVRAAAAKDVVRQVAAAIQSARAQDATGVRISLKPASLGELRIDLTAVGSRLRGRIRTETAAARDLILSRLDELRRTLEDLGIHLSGFQVEVERRPSPDGPGSRGRGASEAPVSEEAEGGPRSHRRQRIDLRA